jgi:small subunit ribosomal protein S4
MHGRRRQFRRRESDYAVQLRGKQRVRRTYGVLERQFRRYFKRAEKQSGLTGVNLLTLLERRLDNVVYRMGFADSRAQARQLVSHGHFQVNGRKAAIPSFLVKPGDEIAVRDRSRKLTYFKDLASRLDQINVPQWMTMDPNTLSGRILEIPSRDDIDIPADEQLVVEYYSRT